MGEPNEIIKRRATANAIWKPLRHALFDGWPLVTDWTHHDPRGNPHTSDLQTGGIPGPLPTYTPTNEIGRILTRLEPKDWPSNGLILNALLLETDYDRLAAQQTHQAYLEWTDAWGRSNARRPFLQEENRHGNPTLRRNHDPQALITQGVADFLEALADASIVTLHTPEQDAKAWAALLTDDDVPERIKPAEVFAIAQKSGIDESD